LIPQPRGNGDSAKEETPKAQHVRRLASLARTKQEVLESLRHEAARRDPQRHRPLAVLLDGAVGLGATAVKIFALRNLL
jgi:hypothetical protein